MCFCDGLRLAAQADPPDAAHNDYMFAAAPSARSSIDYDARGFLVNGKRTFLVSAGLEYARMPRGEWADRLLRLKRAGFNAVEFYTFWDFHEPHESQFDFSGDHDLNAFLQLVKSMDMYAIARVGPYSCAEWSLGGYPIWLRFKPGVVLRTENQPFLQAVDRFWDRLLPIIAANQIHRGGSVVLVQLENEHPSAAGTGLPNPYFTHLREQALKHSIEVPYFFSGMHHGSDPAGDAVSLDNAARPNPWITTEYWSVWFNQYGSRQADAATYRRRTWKIIAHGGNAYNVYMAFGGSNFDFSNNNEDAASYDYGSPVGQGGDLRPTYYEFKKANYFAQSFSDLLENSEDSSAHWATAVNNPGVRISARKGPAGEIVFIDAPPPRVKKVASPDPNNPTFEAVTDTVDTNKVVTTTFVAPGVRFDLSLQQGEILPLVHGVSIAPGVTLDWSAARILGIARDGHTTTLAVYGDAGWRDTLIFTGSALTTDDGSAPRQTLTLGEPYAPEAPVVRQFHCGTETVRVLLLTREQADRTWFDGKQGQELVLQGPAYLAEVAHPGQTLTAETEAPYGEATSASAGTVMVYGEGNPLSLNATAAPSLPQTALALSAWQMRSGSAAAPGFVDAAWTKTPDPVELGAEGDLSSYAWYRSSVSVPKAGDYLFTPVAGGDHAKLYVDGNFITEGAFSARPLPVTLTAGSHSVAVFASHYGRQKMFAYLGGFADHDPKGLTGPVVLRQGTTRELSGWRWHNVRAGESATVPPPDSAGWLPYRIGLPRGKRTPENGGAAWFLADLPDSAQSYDRRVLRFTSVDESATIYVSGKELGSFRGRDQAFSVEVPSYLTGPLQVQVLVRGAGRPHNITGPVFLEQTIGNLLIKGWRSHGGPETVAAAISAEAEWTQGTAQANFPVFHRSTFSVGPEILQQTGVTWRISTAGLGHGSVWLNGHNLGRYPEKVAVDGELLPHAWLVAGVNQIVVFDEDGRNPGKVRIYAEAGASRSVIAYRVMGTHTNTMAAQPDRHDADDARGSE